MQAYCQRVLVLNLRGLDRRNSRIKTRKSVYNLHVSISGHIELCFAKYSNVSARFRALHATNKQEITRY